MAIKAIRYERFGDAALAARTWQSVKSKNDKEGGDRTWWLLAAREAKEQKDKAPTPTEEGTKRRELLTKCLDTAEQLTKEDKKAEARRKLNELVLLYSDRSEVGPEVEKANNRLEKLRQP